MLERVAGFHGLVGRSAVRENSVKLPSIVNVCCMFSGSLYCIEYAGIEYCLCSGCLCTYLGSSETTENVMNFVPARSLAKSHSTCINKTKILRYTRTWVLQGKNISLILEHTSGKTFHEAPNSMRTKKHAAAQAHPSEKLLIPPLLSTNLTANLGSGRIDRQRWSVQMRLLFWRP